MNGKIVQAHILFQGFAESFIEMISGSYSNVIGLPMHITFKILKNNKLI